ncbi:hypothetical protein QQF64_034015 [Cirrhinus molitorella]|uniref:Uncharacterized protein n=1 Tax=Cirrhinus molitorella TaxID=172907 RepID=A0ABR3MVJ8_9TELE
MEEQLNDKIQDNRFALQMDEATDNNKDCLLITYVRFIDADDLREDLLFCKLITKRATADELFKIIDTYLKEADLKWDDCVGICTDGAQAMAGKRGGLQALIKHVSPNVQWTHCVIHREALASKHESPQIFCALCEEMGSEHTAVLFHSESHWLSRGKVLSRVFELMRSESSWRKREMNLPISGTITTFS